MSSGEAVSGTTSLPVVGSPSRLLPALLAVFLGVSVLGVVGFYTQPPRDATMFAQIAHALLAGASILMLFAAFGERSLWVILFAVVVFGYMLKPLGLVLATGLLVFISAWGGHEFKLREAIISFVVLSIFSVATFIYGLALPINIWPDLG